MKSYITKDGKHGLQIFDNGNSFLAFATQDNGRGGFEHWFTVGKSYKSAETALRQGRKSLLKHGYEI